MKVQITYRSMATSLGLVKNGDIVDLPAAEVEKILVTKPRSLVILPEEEAPKKAPAKRKTKVKKDD